MAAPQQPIIIIRRKKKGVAHAPHHGGAWKVAYADFVTAMMAFFLLLWLLNVTTDVERRGIADYFAPSGISQSTSGAGGVMGGRTLTQEGAQMASQSQPSTEDQTIPTVGQGNEGDEDTSGKNQEAGGSDKAAQESAAAQAQNQAKTGGPATGANAAAGGGENGPVGLGQGGPAEEKAVAEAMKHEEEHFKQAEEVLKKAIQDSPELREFAGSLMVDRTPEGLRIQIIDRDNLSMFPSGSATPYERARDLLRLVGKVISRLPNNISVTGHTDSAPFTLNSRRDNWSLSTERANVSREALVSAGVADGRISRVVGMSDREPLVKNDPKNAKNRRISIVLLRQTLPPAELPPTAAIPAAEAPAAAETKAATPPPVAKPAADPTKPVMAPLPANIKAAKPAEEKR